MQLRHQGSVLFALVLAALITPSSHGATLFGLELGANLSGYSTSPDQKTSGRAGLLAGGIFDFSLADNLSLQPGLHYIQKGFASGTYTQTEHYLEIPVALRGKWALGGGFSVYGLAGPDLGIEFAHYYSILLGAVFFNTMDFSFDLGAGAEYALSDALNLFLQLRYSLGLVNVVQAGQPAISFTGKSHGFQITAGVSFPL